MASEKRAASNSFSAPSAQLVKRQKSDASMNGQVALANGSGRNGALIHAVPRHSGLQSPVMELTGHAAEVFAVRFDPMGQFIASGSMDRNILLWRTYGDCENYGKLSGHGQAVLDLHWSRDSTLLWSASADKQLAMWDVDTGTRLRRYRGHEEVINSMDISKRGEEFLLSGSDDGSIGLWDARSKEAVDVIETDFPITAVALSEAGNEFYTGGIDNDIKVWDIRKKAVAYSLLGHNDTITSLQVSPDAQYLLSNSHDSTVRTWDIRPFAPVNRHVKNYDGAPTGMERNLLKATWDPSGKKIAAGSGDRSVTVWETSTGKILHKLPGHKGAVNDVRFHPGGEPIIVSGSSDRNILLGELGN